MSGEADVAAATPQPPSAEAAGPISRWLPLLQPAARTGLIFAHYGTPRSQHTLAESTGICRRPRTQGTTEPPPCSPWSAGLHDPADDPLEFLASWGLASSSARDIAARLVIAMGKKKGLHPWSATVMRVLREHGAEDRRSGRVA